MDRNKRIVCRIIGLLVSVTLGAGCFTYVDIYAENIITVDTVTEITQESSTSDQVLSDTASLPVKSENSESSDSGVEICDTTAPDTTATDTSATDTSAIDTAATDTSAIDTTVTDAETFDAETATDSDNYENEADQIEVIVTESTYSGGSGDRSAKQWYLNTINASGAWKIAESWTESKAGNTVIAVIDTGVISNHEDFDEEKITAISTYPISVDEEERSPEDVAGHGTQVIGVIAADSDNNKGIKGIASDAQILSIRSGGTEISPESLSILSVAAGIEYAVSKNVDVINLSLGVLTDSFPDVLKKTIQNAIGKALAAGIPVVCSSGNYGSDSSVFPACISGVISVAGVQKNGDGSITLWPYSSTGSNTTVAAPASSIYTTNKKGGYSFAYGTSFSAPMVTAAVSLLIGIDKKINNTDKTTLTVDEITKLIKESCTAKVTDTHNTDNPDIGVLNAENLLALYLKEKGLPLYGKNENSDKTVDVSDFENFLHNYANDNRGTGDGKLSTQDTECSDCESEGYCYCITGKGKICNCEKYYSTFQHRIAKRISNAAENDVVNVYTRVWESIDENVLKTLESRSDVTLVIHYVNVSSNENAELTIPGGSSASMFDDGSGYAGFEYIRMVLARKQLKN